MRKGDSAKGRVSFRHPERSLLVRVSRIQMCHYAAFQCDKARLRELATPVCEVEASSTADLEQIRRLINRTRPPLSCPSLLCSCAVGGEGSGNSVDCIIIVVSVHHPDGPRGEGEQLMPEAPDWTFTDTVTAARFFRIDRAQESLHYVMDICDVSVDDESGKSSCTLYIVPDEDGEDNATAVELDRRSPLRQVASNPAPQKASLHSVTKGSPVKKKLGPAAPVSAALSNGSSSQQQQQQQKGQADDDEPCEMINNNLLLSKPTQGVVVAPPISPDPLGASGTALPPQSPHPIASPSPAVLSSSPRLPTVPQPSPATHRAMERTTEGILKAARLGDLRMLSELHAAGYSLLSIDETGKTALHYGARFGHKEVS